MDPFSETPSYRGENVTNPSMELMMKAVLKVLALAMLIPVVAGSQTTTLAGARVRVTSPRDALDREIATVVKVRGDSLAITGRSGSRTIAFGNVTALDVSTGTRTRFLRDAGIGFAAGALAGVLVGVASYEECSADCWFGPSSVSESAALGGVVFGAIGLMAGALVGIFDRDDRWERASLPVRASIGPSRSGGVSLNFSRTF